MINALKSLMQIPDWPTNLVVSGTPELHDLLTQDPQLSRRFFITRFLPATEFDACDDVAELVARYAGLADLPLAPDLADMEFVPGFSMPLVEERRLAIDEFEEQYRG